jgi:broad specificity phosphatase PhoE
MSLFDIKKIVEQCNSHDQLVICMRHAEKNRNFTNEDKYVPLTTYGIVEAHQLGKFISSHFQELAQIKTSPLLRCKHTADILASYYQAVALPIQLSKLLGDPGAFVKDHQQAAKVFDQYSVYEVVQQQIAGNALPGFHPTDYGVSRLCHELLTAPQDAHKPIIWISHDVVLTAFLGFFLAEKIILNQQQWINYLEGFCIVRQNAQWFIHLVGHSFAIQIKEKTYGRD